MNVQLPLYSQYTPLACPLKRLAKAGRGFGGWTGNHQITKSPNRMTVAFKMKLKPGFEEEYKKRHGAIWPELSKLLKERGISDYSIFLDNETNILFAVQKVSGDRGSQDLGKNPIVKKWWAYMADIMDTNADFSPVTTPLQQVFHLD
jgi:L-rhamnose mutarotase